MRAATTGSSAGSSPADLKVRALWCPLTLPGESTLEQSARAETRQAFYEEFGLTGLVDSDWSSKGQPANSDFTLWLTGPDSRDDYLLVQEYSYSMPPQLQDFREQGAHLDELLRHRRIVDSRSVFARVTAEVEGESFELSGDIKNYLGALTSHDKPLYKLCQASSYAEATVQLLQKQGLLNKACTVRALAVTSAKRSPSLPEVPSVTANWKAHESPGAAVPGTTNPGLAAVPFCRVTGVPDRCVQR